MRSPIDREGAFRCEIIEYGLRQGKEPSKSVGVSIKCRLLEMYDYDTESWISWDYDQEAEGSVWIVKQDGVVSDKAVESLVANAGWDGTIESVVNRTWTPTRCQVAVKVNEYKGNTSYQASFVNAWNSVPGTGNVSPEAAKTLALQYGASLRAVAGTVKQNAAKPAGKPSAPAKPAARETVPANGIPADEVPF